MGTEPELYRAGVEGNDAGKTPQPSSDPGDYAASAC
jgi:hypothetical protein